MVKYRTTPENTSQHDVIMDDTAWDSRRNGSHAFHPIMTKAHGPIGMIMKFILYFLTRLAKIIAKPVISRHLSDPPEKVDGNFPKIITGHQNFYGSSGWYIIITL
jgi:hypothetical protein